MSLLFLSQARSTFCKHHASQKLRDGHKQITKVLDYESVRKGRECITGLVEVLREEGLEAVWYALWDMTNWHRDYDPCIWRGRTIEERLTPKVCAASLFFIPRLTASTTFLRRSSE